MRELVILIFQPIYDTGLAGLGGVIALSVVLELIKRFFTGMANAVCAALDTLHWSGVVGTLAGDDTIFMVMRDDHNARELVLQLRKMMSAGQ